MANYDINFNNLSPKLLEMAMGAQYANRERLASKEFKKEIKKKVQVEVDQRITANPAATDLKKKKEGGQLEHERKKVGKVKATRRRRGNGFLLAPSRPPEGEFIELITGGDFDACAFGNLGKGTDKTNFPGFVYSSEDGGVLLLETTVTPYAFGTPTQKYAYFYHVADNSEPPKKPGIVEPDPTPANPFPNDLYQSCTFEAIVRLGSTPSLGTFVLPSVNSRDGNYRISGIKSNYVSMPEYFVEISVNYPPGWVGPPRDMYMSADVYVTSYTYPDNISYANMNCYLGGYIFQFYYRNLQVTKWQLYINGVGNSGALSLAQGIQYNSEFDSFLLDGNQDIHIAVVYSNENVRIYVAGSLFATATSPVNNRNTEVRGTFFESNAYNIVNVIDDPVVEFIYDSNGTAIEGLRKPVPIVEYSAVVNQWLSHGFFKVGRAVYNTTECQTGFHSLRFTPEEALYEGPSFTPPTRITDLA